MRKTIASVLVVLLVLATLGCGTGNKASPKAGDPATKNTVDPPDATRLPGQRK